MKNILTVTSKDGTKIAYNKMGTGPSLIIVLGSLNSRKSGARLARFLAPNFTVYNYDRRGRGDSTDTPPYSPKREVEDLEALIKEAGEPVYLYGHSAGAAIVVEAAVRLGKRIKKIAIYEAPYSLTPEAHQKAREYNRQVKDLLAAGRNDDAVALFMQYVCMSEKQIHALKNMRMWRGLEALAPTLAYDSDLLGEGHSLPSALLARVTIPTLVMHGGAGAAMMREAAQAISKAVPHSRFRTVAGQTHGVSPSVIAPVLTEFFTG